MFLLYSTSCYWLRNTFVFKVWATVRQLIYDHQIKCMDGFQRWLAGASCHMLRKSSCNTANNLAVLKSFTTNILFSLVALKQPFKFDERVDIEKTIWSYRTEKSWEAERRSLKALDSSVLQNATFFGFIFNALTICFSVPVILRTVHSSNFFKRRRKILCRDLSASPESQSFFHEFFVGSSGYGSPQLLLKMYTSRKGPRSARYETSSRRFRSLKCLLKTL